MIDTIGVIGAGSSGLAAARNLLDRGFDVEILERESDLGGNWNIDLPCARVYRSTHTISSKPGTEYPDFPMPDSFPDYPHHSQILRYLRDYARAFDLEPHIRYGADVAAVRPVRDGARWQVDLRSGDRRDYAAVVIANGHNWDPKYPEYPGRFHGDVMHAAQYKTPDVLAGRRVLVVGAGNSGCDIAVESAQNARATFHSTRRGYHYVPKYLFGKPADQVGDVLLRLGVPLWLRRAIAQIIVRMHVGRPEDAGLPVPDHRLFETHPIVNSLLTYYVRHGAILPRPDVHRLEGERVRFADHSAETVDLILYATGYNIRFPFLEEGIIRRDDGRPRLHLNVFHPEYDNFFVAGLIQPDSGQFGLVHWQTRSIALFLRALEDQRPAAVRLRRRKRGAHRTGGGIRYKDSTRHYLEVEHHGYEKALRKLVADLS